MGSTAHCHTFLADPRSVCITNSSISYTLAHRPLYRFTFACSILHRFAICSAREGDHFTNAVRLTGAIYLTNANQDASAYTHSDPAQRADTHMHAPEGLDRLHYSTRGHAL
jgi:hypothetical protein